MQRRKGAEAQRRKVFKVFRLSQYFLFFFYLCVLATLRHPR